MSDRRVTQLLDELQNVLEEQKEKVRRSDLRGVEASVRRAGVIVEDIVRMWEPQRISLGKRGTKLMRLYSELQLMVAAQKHNVNEQVRRVTEGRKALETYRGYP